MLSITGNCHSGYLLCCRAMLTGEAHLLLTFMSSNRMRTRETGLDCVVAGWLAKVFASQARAN
jgi:hypothetical protein